MANSREALAKFLAGVFEAKTTSKSKLSDDTGIGRSQIDGYLKEENAASIDQLDRLAKELDKKPWELIRPKGDKESETKESILGALLIDAASLEKDELLEVRNLAQDFVKRRLGKSGDLEQKSSKLK